MAWHIIQSDANPFNNSCSNNEAPPELFCIAITSHDFRRCRVGDVESNPYPTHVCAMRTHVKLVCMYQTVTQYQNKTDKNIPILQINNTSTWNDEFRQLAHTTHPDIITVYRQNSQRSTFKTLNMSNYIIIY